MSSASVTGSVKPGGPLKVTLAYCTCFLLWGSTWSVVKVGLEDLPPLRFVGIRMLVAGLALLPFTRSRGAPLGPGLARRIAGLGMLQIAIPFGLLFVGQQWIPSSWAALLFSTFPVWLLLVGRVMLPDQHLTGRKLLAAGLGVAGVVVLQHSGLGDLKVSGHMLLGGLLCLASVAVISVANVLAKKHMGHVPAHVMVFGQTFSSAIPLLALSFLFEAGQPMNWSTRSVLAVLYLALCGTVLTYQCLYWLLPRISLAALGAMALLDTLVAVVLGVVFLDEPLTLSLLLGGALILGGAALANLIPAAEPARQDAPPATESPPR